MSLLGHSHAYYEPADVQLFTEDGGGEDGGDHGAERVEHGGVERASHRDAPRLQVERDA